jgi:hypothetical protein
LTTEYTSNSPGPEPVSCEGAPHRVEAANNAAANNAAFCNVITNLLKFNFESEEVLKGYIKRRFFLSVILVYLN